MIEENQQSLSSREASTGAGDDSLQRSTRLPRASRESTQAQSSWQNTENFAESGNTSSPCDAATSCDSGGSVYNHPKCAVGTRHGHSATSAAPPRGRSFTSSSRTCLKKEDPRQTLLTFRMLPSPRHSWLSAAEGLPMLAAWM